MEADRFWGRARATSIDVELLAAVLFMRELFIKLEFVELIFASRSSSPR